MNLEQQVCTAEQGEKLWELGVRMPSLCHWDMGTVSITPNPVLVQYRKGLDVPAYTVAELGKMLTLAYGLHVNKGVFFGGNCSYVKGRNGYEPRIVPHDNIYSKSNSGDETEAQQRAALLIWAIENKHVSVDEINKPD